MTHGQCPLDKKDDMAFLKEEMMGSDLIIWGSPVYALHVSGQMKTFLDRLVNWYHTLRLAGKSGVTVSTTAGSGLEEVHQYLRLLLSVSGVKTIYSLDTIGTLPSTIVDPESAQKSADKAANEVYTFLNGEKRIESDKWLEYSFQKMKDKVMHKDALNADYEYWKEHEMLEMNSFKELLQKKL
jgi:multimeric flavodoxin WrbA